LKDSAVVDGAASDVHVVRDAAADTRPACTITDDCVMGKNCYRGDCVAATVSCASQKSSYPTSVDGIYWINPSGTPMRAYCDMQVQTELCTEVEGDHHGTTREGSNLSFVMTSVLHASDGECLLWALRASADDYPLAGLDGQAPLSTCQWLGFVSDGVLGGCPFGDGAGSSDCGFPISLPYYQWGNACSGCVIGDGVSDTYVKQGPMHTSFVVSTFDGSVQSRCKVR
jgi:hypothetical protein